ncbi:hypothetical protein [Litchfieldia alkalitelluris]|uniref:hypothetical protein n=1 Tax=Litchfieldia alkalitelluris TaxID=304268 RepID=UPI0009980B7D|nr:hypothetical protein [Litchfieldia alkalitelluris]
MKKLIGLLIVLTIILLCVTKSTYVEGSELFIIIGSLAVISIIYNLKHNRFSVISSHSAVIGFLCFWVFGLTDLILDHFIYFLPTGNEDGSPLTLGMKMNEYSDDMFVASVLLMLSVVVISNLVLFFLKLPNKIRKVPS